MVTTQSQCDHTREPKYRQDSHYGISVHTNADNLVRM